MNITEFMAWLCANNGQTAYQIWKKAYLRSHPEKSDLPDFKLNIWYSTDNQIKSYWGSDIGKINHWLILFWLRVKKPRLRWHLYWLIWRLKLDSRSLRQASADRALGLLKARSHINRRVILSRSASTKIN